MEQSLKGRSILIVEDQAIISLHIQSILGDVGARIVTAPNLRTALAAVKDSTLSAAIIDYLLEDGNNSEICEQLNARGIPFVLFSGAPRPIGECAQGTYLEKPTTAAKLLASVEALFERGQLRWPAGSATVH
jgi:DNA-binding response OmpR family regulator